MVKKVISKIKDADKQKFSKVIMSRRSEKTGAYTFKNKILVSTEVQKFIEENAK